MIDAILIPLPQCQDRPLIAMMVSFITYSVPGVCVCVVYMVEDKFDDSPAVCHVFDDQVFIRSAVYCPYWSYNAMPLFFLKRIHKQAFSLIKDDSNNVGILNICDFIFLLSLFALDYLFRGILYM